MPGQAKGKVAAACVSGCGQREFYGFFFLLFPFCSPSPPPPTPLVCVIMCKVEEKQLEAVLSGDGEAGEGIKTRRVCLSFRSHLPARNPARDRGDGWGFYSRLIR